MGRVKERWLWRHYRGAGVFVVQATSRQDIDIVEKIGRDAEKKRRTAEWLKNTDSPFLRKLVILIAAAKDSEQHQEEVYKIQV